MSFRFFRTDPGPCPICGAAHTACLGPEGAVLEVVQMPARDRAAAAPRAPIEVVQLPCRDAAVRVPPVQSAPLAPDTTHTTVPSRTFATARYRGKRRTTAAHADGGSTRGTTHDTEPRVAGPGSARASHDAPPDTTTQSALAPTSRPHATDRPRKTHS